MSKTPVKSSILLADFEDEVNQGLIDPEHITVLGTDGTGTHLVVKRLKNPLRRGRRPSDYANQTLLVSDLVGANIVRTGSFTATIAANNLTVLTTTAISPALPNTTGFRAWCNVRAAAQAFSFGGSARISSTTVLQVMAYRELRPEDLKSGDQAAGQIFPTDTQIDPGTGHSHAADGGGATAHQHNLMSIIIAAATVTVEWWISSIIN